MAGANTGNDLSATGSSAGANKKKQTINIVVFQHAFLLACVHIYIINELAERILCTLRLRMFQTRFFALAVRKMHVHKDAIV